MAEFPFFGFFSNVEFSSESIFTLQFVSLIFFLSYVIQNFRPKIILENIILIYVNKLKAKMNVTITAYSYHMNW